MGRARRACIAEGLQTTEEGQTLAYLMAGSMVESFARRTMGLSQDHPCVDAETSQKPDSRLLLDAVRRGCARVRWQRGAPYAYGNAHPSTCPGWGLTAGWGQL